MHLTFRTEEENHYYLGTLAQGLAIFALPLDVDFLTERYSFFKSYEYFVAGASSDIVRN